MLQQTQAARVEPAFERFLTAFPTVRSLAAAPRSDVIRAWAGLGYNRRAVALSEAARAIERDHEGRVPSEPGRASRRSRASAPTRRPRSPRSRSALPCPPSTRTPGGSSPACGSGSTRTTCPPPGCASPPRRGSTAAIPEAGTRRSWISDARSAGPGPGATSVHWPADAGSAPRARRRDPLARVRARSRDPPGRSAARSLRCFAVARRPRPARSRIGRASGSSACSTRSGSSRATASSPPGAGALEGRARGRVRLSP